MSANHGITKQDLIELFSDFKNEFKKDFATKTDLKQFATKEDLKQFATKNDLKQFATKEDLVQFATKNDLKQFASKVDLKNFATKEDLTELKKYLSSEISNAVESIIEILDEHDAKFIKKSDIVKFSQQINI